MKLDLMEMRCQWQKWNSESTLYELPSGHLAIDIMEFGAKGWENPHQHPAFQGSARIDRSISRAEYEVGPTDAQYDSYAAIHAGSSTPCPTCTSTSTLHRHNAWSPSMPIACKRRPTSKSWVVSSEREHQGQTIQNSVTQPIYYSSKV